MRILKGRGMTHRRNREEKKEIAPHNPCGSFGDVVSPTDAQWSHKRVFSKDAPDAQNHLRHHCLQHYEQQIHPSILGIVPSEINFDFTFEHGCSEIIILTCLRREHSKKSHIANNDRDNTQVSSGSKILTCEKPGADVSTPYEDEQDATRTQPPCFLTSVKTVLCRQRDHITVEQILVRKCH